MARAVNLIWLAAILSVLALLGQTLGIYDMPMLHDFRVPSPFGQTPQGVDATPNAPPPSVATRPLAASSAPMATDSCTADAPRFVQGTAALKAGVGAIM